MLGLEPPISAVTIILTLQVRLEGIKDTALACLIICKVTICTEFRQFGKTSTYIVMSDSVYHPTESVTL